MSYVVDRASVGRIKIMYSSELKVAEFLIFLFIWYMI